jgi:protein associated with RNAse G/E
MITVRAYKYDGSEHRTWSANMLRRTDSLLVLDATFAEEVQHELLGTIVQGTSSIEYYWLDRWYNIFRFAEPDGQLRNYYCNVNVPPKFDGEVLSYVDLDIDILVNADFSYAVLDLDEFAENAMAYSYPQEVRENAQRAVGELMRLIETRTSPFDE